ncbi:MAG: hypothetical protein ABI794_03540, partial [Betaproteobacteria bacterium]
MNAPRAFVAAFVLLMAPGAHAADSAEVSSSAAACETCGVIRSIREIRSERPVPRVGGASDPRASLAYQTSPGAPMLVGPVIGSRWSARGQSEAFVGALGSDRMLESLQQVSWEVIVRLNDGAYTRVVEADA